MIGYLHGRVIALYTDHCLLDVHGVGYRFEAPAAPEANK